MSSLLTLQLAILDEVPMPTTSHHGSKQNNNAPIQALIASADLSPVASAKGDGGTRAESEALFASLYSELHRLAKRELARSQGAVTLSATTLLHEAYLDISGREGNTFTDRARFMGYASRVMRGLIIDYARRRHALKRGGQFEITSIDVDSVGSGVDDATLTQIADALDDLAIVEPVLARIVDLKFFCGFSFAEIGAICDMSERTAQRNWEKARLYLHRSFKGADAEGGGAGVKV